ncbi:hypothetical protein [Amycolatopsis sp. NPDC004079]|uniref:hypothetical protein n=1 Tax=Amycolatopsis sp. NPDC004079 TaxID=3154549 RepID=UPI00339F1276
MAATIPVPIQFSLPEGWRSVPPDDVGTPESAFVALCPSEARQGFTPNISISGEIRQSIDLIAIGDEAVDNLRAAGAQGVKLGRRDETGTAANPGLAQAVKLVVPLGGRTVDLVQYQVFLLIRDQRDLRREAVLHVVLSALLEEQFQRVIGDFQKFLETIQPEKASS